MRPEVKVVVELTAERHQQVILVRCLPHVDGVSYRAVGKICHAGGRTGRPGLGLRSEETPLVSKTYSACSEAGITNDAWSSQWFQETKAMAAAVIEGRHSGVDRMA